MDKFLKVWAILYLLGSLTALAANIETATLAAGCFWGVEEMFRKIPGVTETQVGYTGGKGPSTYEKVSTGTTGHAESVEIKFDPNKISYAQLLMVFFKMHDPTTLNRQGNDTGTQYRSAIFTHSGEQNRTAQSVKKQVEDSGAWKKPIVTEISPAGTFYRAEEYHQKYLIKNPGGYDNHFMRDLDFDKRIPKMSKSELKKKLTAQQFDVTQNADTEPPFHNEYWNNHEAGIYVDVVSGEPLFSSLDKFDSGTGWPSFSRPLVKENLVNKVDRSIVFSERIEVRSKLGDSHLGHLFNDGPAPTGQRYCINSASLRFIPKNDLAKEGYGQFLGLFKNK